MLTDIKSTAETGIDWREVSRFCIYPGLGISHQVCGLTGSEEGVAALRQSPALLEILVTLLLDPAPGIATHAALALINL